MPVLPPGGGLAICAVGRAAWATEWRLTGKKVWDMTPEEVRDGGMEAVLRCPVGWSGDHRVVSPVSLSFVPLFIHALTLIVYLPQGKQGVPTPSFISRIWLDNERLKELTISWKEQN